MQVWIRFLWAKILIFRLIYLQPYGNEPKNAIGPVIFL